MHATTETRNDVARLRQALDNAIYTLEGIKRRAASGVASDVASWQCEEIRELAATALARLESVYAPFTRSAD